MKKKFLSLMMAAAVVATTSVSAFAQDRVIEGSDTTEQKAEIDITGQVLGDNGEVPAGTFNVSIPTTAAFTVDQNANLESATIKISNRGTQNIDVYADSFVDLTKENGKGITAVEESQLTNQNRTFVNLKIFGRRGSVYLKTEQTAGEKGLYKESSLTNKAKNDDLRLATIATGQEGVLTLEGKAGKNQAGLGDDVKTRGVQDKFTLTLKIKKSTNNESTEELLSVN